jgi:hypothetical protein
VFSQPPHQRGSVVHLKPLNKKGIIYIRVVPGGGANPHDLAIGGFESLKNTVSL